MARQRQAAGEFPGREPGSRALSSYRGCVRGPEKREGTILRLTNHAAASGVGRATVPRTMRRAGPSRVVLRNPVCPFRLRPKAKSTAETTVTGFDRSPGRARSKPEDHRVRECRANRRDRGDDARVLTFICARGCGCVEHPAFPRALEGGVARMGHAPRAPGDPNPRAHPRREIAQLCPMEARLAQLCLAKERLMAPGCLTFKSECAARPAHQMLGFQGTITWRYPSPAFSICASAGNGKWNPCTSIFSAASMSNTLRRVASANAKS